MTGRGELAGGLPFLARGTGPPLVVLVGLTGSHRSFSWPERWLHWQIVRPLTRSFTVYLVSRRPGLPAGTTVVDFADHNAAALRSRFREPVRMMGISTGGIIAQQLAASFPELVDRLVLASTADRLSAVGRAEQRRVASLARDRPAVISMLLGQIPPGRVARLLDRLACLAQRTRDPRDSDDLITTIAAEDDFDGRAVIGAITAPTLVIGGAHDLAYDVGLMRETADAIPDAKLIVYPRRGHVTALLDRRFGRDVLAFLQP